MTVEISGAAATSPPNGSIEENIRLAPFTTIGIGGVARYFTSVTTVDALKQTFEWAAKASIPVLVLGGGSNMLIADSGWSGLVIRIAISGIQMFEGDNGTPVRVGAGTLWDDLVAFAVQNNLQGIECLSGIPGTVGASPIQNIGAYGQEVKDTITAVEVLDRHSLELRRFSTEECGFGYRWSRFKGDDRDRYVVTSVEFRLKKDGAPSLRYGDLTRYFESADNNAPTLSDVRDAVLTIRRSKGMVIDPSDGNSHSCGSFFMNPIVPAEQANELQDQLRANGLLDSTQIMPQYPAGEGHVKLSAAWLMEKSGLEKGFAIGNAGLSARHILALINRGGATAKEIVELAEYVKNTVKSKFGIELHPEPVFVGFDDKTGSERNMEMKKS